MSSEQPIDGFDDFFEVEIPIEAPLARMYELVTNIEGLTEFFPGVSFKLESEAPFAVGSTYLTRSKGFKSWVPYRVLALDQDARMSAELVGKDPIFKHMRYDHRFLSRGGTNVSVERVDYTFRYGVVGKLLNVLVGKRMVRKQVLDAHEKLREVASRDA